MLSLRTTPPLTFPLLHFTFPPLHDQAQRHSKDEIYQRYPFEDSIDHHGELQDLADGVRSPLQEASSSPVSPDMDAAVPRAPLRAMLRPLLRESDFSNWQKAAGINTKWVSLLSEEQLSAFNVLREGSELGTVDISSSSAIAAQPDQQQLLFGVAVIKNAIVVNSAAYLKVQNPSNACSTVQTARMTGVGDLCMWV